MPDARRIHSTATDSHFSLEEASHSFAEVYEQNHSRIYRLALRMMGNPDDAFDLTQEAFISAYRHYDAVEPDSNISAWLYRIAANKCLDALRRRKRIRWQPWNNEAHDHLRKASAGQPEQRLLSVETADEIQQVLEELPDDYRLALLLREQQDLPLAQVADILGRSESATKSLLFRAREQFRKVHSLQSALSRQGG